MGRTQPLKKYPILETLVLIKEMGFSGVEICLENNDINPNLLTDELICSIKNRLDILALDPVSVSYHKNYIYNDSEFLKIKQAIPWTNKFGSNIFIISGGKKRTKNEGEWSRMLKRTKELVQIAEENNIILALEFEPNFVIGTTEELLRLFNEIPSPNLAANCDLGHVFLCDPNPLAAIRKTGKKIVHCHIENMKTNVHDHLVPEEGDMDLIKYLDCLKKTGFSGGLALDLYKYDYESVGTGSADYLKKLLESINKN